ncbi:PrpF domain-containing protein [Bacillus sp. JJ1533]|uniref:PrpF domain-containing protein n=1 Tax=Bacillus sp. JJ1533 TaxID=3122959 RepID=UPI002FFE5046
MIIISQFSIPCVVYRGGTSRGIFFNEKYLPKDLETRKQIFMAGIDAYNPSQVNGLGSGTSHTSKVCVIAKSNGAADVDYTFYQIGIGEELVDDKGTCGNLMAAVGAYAVDEGLVDIESSDGYVKVTVCNTNIKKMLTIHVPVVAGKAKVNGDFYVPGLKLPGAKYSVEILEPGGGKTGLTLPIGTSFLLKTEEKSYNVSFVDVVNPFVFVLASELGIKGIEMNDELSQNHRLRMEIESIRLRAAVAAGMYPSIEVAKETPSVPKIAIVAEPQNYVTSSGTIVKSEEIDIVAKMLSMGKFHRTFAGSGLYCIAAAAVLPNTNVNQYARKKDLNEEMIRVGHPDGIAMVKVGLTEDKTDVAYVGLERTARRIMKGDLFVPESN